MKRKYRKDDNPLATGFILVTLLISFCITINFIPKQQLTLERFTYTFFIIFAITAFFSGITLIAAIKIWKKYVPKKTARCTFQLQPTTAFHCRPQRTQEGNKTPKNEKKFLTPAKIEFKKHLRQNLPENIEIHCKVRLADIIKKETTYRRIMMMHVDYALLNTNTEEIILVIELDDKSHETEKAKEPDQTSTLRFF